MTILTELEKLLDAKEEALSAVFTGASFSEKVTFWNRIDKADRALYDALSDDTIRALLDVADEVTRRAPFLVADPENDRLLNLAAVLTRAPLVKEANHE